MKENQIEVVEVKENEDGSATLTLELSDETFNIFLREGIRLLMPDEYKDKVMVCSPSIHDKNVKMKTVEMPEAEINAIFEFAIVDALKKYIEEQKKKEKFV